MVLLKGLNLEFTVALQIEKGCLIKGFEITSWGCDFLF